MKKLIILAFVTVLTSCSEYVPNNYAVTEKFVISHRDSGYNAGDRIWNYRLWLQTPTETFDIYTNAATFSAHHTGDTVLMLTRFVYKK